MTHATLKLGSLLRQHRLDAHLTQAELAKQLHYHRSHVARVERNERLPSADYLQGVIDILELDPKEQELLWALFRGDDEPMAAATAPPSTTAPHDWNLAPDTATFFGREDELATLTRWVVDDRCRVVAVLGMRGIGKSMTATRLARQVAGRFDVVIWRSLLNAPSLKELLDDWIRILAEQQEVELPKDENQRLARLIHYLRHRRCLLVLDNLETVLQDAEWTEPARPEAAAYRRLLQQIAQTSHQSCLLLTSRIRPDELVPLAGETAPVRFFYLGGLPPADARQVLADKVLAGDDRGWQALTTRYGGNPHFLKIVAARIQDLYSGHIGLFLHDEQGVSSLHTLLDQEFSRLSPVEQSILYWLAVTREPASLAELHRLMVPARPEWQLADAVAGLVGRRSLAERRGASAFTLHPVMMEYVAEELVERILAELIHASPQPAGNPPPLQLFMHIPLLLAQAPPHIRQSQIRLILAPLAQRLATHAGLLHLPRLLQQILATLKSHYAERPGYGGGNLLNLARYLQIPPDGWDFSGLCIWQADLAGMGLHQVNLSHTDLTGSIFTTTFGLIAALAASPGGTQLAAGTAEGELRLWRLPDCLPLLAWQGHESWVLAMAFDRHGQRLATGSEDATVKIWDATSGKCLHTFQAHTNRVRAVVFSHDGATLFSGGDDGMLQAWDVQSGRALHAREAHAGRLRALALTPDGVTLASGGDDGQVKLWTTTGLEPLQTLHAHTSFVRSLAFHPYHRQLASGSENGTVKLWDVARAHAAPIFTGRYSISKLAFHPAGSLLTGAADRYIYLWDVDSGRLKGSFTEHTSRIRDLTFVGDTTILASGGEDQTIRLWDMETGKCTQELQGYNGWIRRLACSPDGQSLCSTTYSKGVVLRDLESGREVRSYQANRDVEAAAFSPDGNTLAAGDDDGTVYLWEVHSGRCRRILQGHADRVRAVAFHPQRPLLASSSADAAIKLWDLQSGECLRTLSEHRGAVLSLAFNPDGTTLASGSYDGTIRLWDPATGACIHVLEGHQDWIRTVAFHPHGRLVASASDDATVKLWDAGTGACLHTLTGHVQRVRAVAFSPDGQLLASAAEDRTVQLWETASVRPVRTLRGHTKRVADVAFHPDGRRLFSGSDDETIKVWEIATGRLLQTIRNRPPYQDTDITGATGLTAAQRASLRALGAIDRSDSSIRLKK